MIRACAALDKEGILVDAAKFPTLSKCVIRKGEPPLTVARAKAMLSIKREQEAEARQNLPQSTKTEVIKK